MSRPAAFKPKYSKTRRKWVLSLPPKNSPTGKRKRLLFDTEDEAKERAKAILDERAPLPSWATAVDPALIAEAVKYDDAVRSLGYRSLSDFCDQHIAALEKAVASPQLGELLDTFQADHSGNWSTGYAASRWKPFRNKLADLEESRIANLDEAFWRDWFANWRNNSNPAPATYNQQLSMLRSIFELRAARVAVPVNPLTDLPALKDRRGDVPVFDPADARKLLLAAWEHDRDLVPFFAIGLFAGLRPDSELMRARFEHIDRKQGHVVVTVTKTRNHRRYVDLEDVLREWLEPWAKAKGSILPANFIKRRQRLVRGFYTTPGAVLAHPGTWEPVVEWEIDITRHSYASYWEAAHRNEPACRERLAANMGHTNYKTFETKYRNARTTDQATEFWGIRPPSSPANIVSIA